MRFLLIISILLLAGCGATLNKLGGIGQLESNIDRLTGKKEISVTSNAMHDFDGDVATTQFGARWSEEYPDTIFLKVVSRSSVRDSDTYVTFESIDISIDGKITRVKLGRTTHDSGSYNSVTSDIYTTSRTAKSIDYDFFKKMVTSPTTKIRVNTRKWYEDVDFQKEKDGIGAELAKASLSRFIDKVEKNKNML